MDSILRCCKTPKGGGAVAGPSAGASVAASAECSQARCYADNSSNTTTRVDSTRLLYMGDNFQQGRSDQDIYFDCQSAEENAPNEGRSASSRCKFDDPSAIREALERAANATQTLLKNFDSSGGWNNPCAVTLEITARLVDPKKTRSGTLHGKPVTVQMPLQFNPQGGGRITPCRKNQPLPKPKGRHQQQQESICSCRSQQPMGSGPKPCTGKSASEMFAPRLPLHITRSNGSGFMGSCGDSSDDTCCCHSRVCPNRYLPDAREVISISYLTVPEPESEPESEEEKLVPLPLEIEEPEEEEEDEEEEEKMPAPKVQKIIEEKSTSETESLSILSEETVKAEEWVRTEPEVRTEPVVSPTPDPKPAIPAKKYFLALPQNKDFSNCSPCRFDPSPIMDEEGNVFCPGNCGCCMCPWKQRNLDDNRHHSNVKVCRCVQRGTIFTKFEDREVCSQSSYFDFCPCREKAEAKFLELYHTEMFDAPHRTRGREIQLSEIRELLVPLRISE